MPSWIAFSCWPRSWTWTDWLPSLACSLWSYRPLSAFAPCSCFWTSTGCWWGDTQRTHSSLSQFASEERPLLTGLASLSLDRRRIRGELTRAHQATLPSGSWGATFALALELMRVVRQALLMQAWPHPQLPILELQCFGLLAAFMVLWPLLPEADSIALNWAF